MCYQIATIDGINAANTTSACALARTENTWYSESLAALEYNHARYVAAILYITRNRSTQEACSRDGSSIRSSGRTLHRRARLRRRRWADGRGAAEHGERAELGRVGGWLVRVRDEPLAPVEQQEGAWREAAEGGPILLLREEQRSARLHKLVAGLRKPLRAERGT